MSNAVVTGGGSGVGRAVTLALAGAGWHVAILGRRQAPLAETAALLPGSDIRVETCDITDAGAVSAVRDRLLAAWQGDLDLLVNAAGINVPARALDRVTVNDFTDIISTNLVGAFHVVHAFLPAMRRRHRGTVVTIASDVGLIGSAKAGAAYVASKFAEVGFTESINAEARADGIRACVICPGDIDTALLEQRPEPPGPEARARMLQPEDVAACVMLAVTLPHRAVVEKLVIRPR